MKKSYPLIACTCAIATLILPGCKNRQDTVWDQHKTSAKNKQAKSLWGNEDVHVVNSEEDFTGPSSEEFIPLSEQDLKAHFADGAVPQPDVVPGEQGSGIPGIDQFKTPSSRLASIFRNLYFNTDDSILRGKDSLAAITEMAAYLKEHPNTYIFVEGHCDERGPEAYNLSLGARRANYVRTMLVKEGVNLNQIHTISYGKEQPLVDAHSPQAWTKNRRAQFKIYEK